MACRWEYSDLKISIRAYISASPYIYISELLRNYWLVINLHSHRLGLSYCCCSYYRIAIVFLFLFVIVSTNIIVSIAFVIKLIMISS